MTQDQRAGPLSEECADAARARATRPMLGSPFSLVDGLKNPHRFALLCGERTPLRCGRWSCPTLRKSLSFAPSVTSVPG
jgi:hypothetical protein